MDNIENLQNLEGNEHFERMGEFNQNKLSCFGLIIFIFFKLMLGLKKVFDYMIEDRFLCVALQKYMQPKIRYARRHI